MVELIPFPSWLLPRGWRALASHVQVARSLVTAVWWWNMEVAQGCTASLCAPTEVGSQADAWCGFRMRSLCHFGGRICLYVWSWWLLGRCLLSILGILEACSRQPGHVMILARVTAAWGSWFIVNSIGTTCCNQGFGLVCQHTVVCLVFSNLFDTHCLSQTSTTTGSDLFAGWRRASLLKAALTG